MVRDFTGHGIGTSFHSGLVIPHYDESHYDDVIEVGMTFTIEPMLNLGTHEWDMWDDDWTVVTKDRRRTAQFEHTLLVTPDRCRGPHQPLNGPILFPRMSWPGGRGSLRGVEEGPGSAGQGGGQHPPGATRGTVPQRTDRPSPEG